MCSRERKGEGTRELGLRRDRAVARALVACACALAACGAPEPSADAGGDAGPCALELALPGEAEQVLEVPGACAIALRASEPRVVEVWADEAIELDGARAAHHGPMRIEAGSRALTLEGAATLHLRDHGPLPPDVRIERSLTWTDPALLDHRDAVGLARLMRVVASDGHGGRLLATWLARFATTSHSERLGPQRLLDAFATEHGDDPSAWDLDRVPFTVTGVHHRVDLRDGVHCGELRVSLASIDPLHQPLHLIFLFRQPAAPADRRADGSAHCASTALRWARLSALDGEPFLAAARALLDEHLAADRLLAIETLELLISPWEWRQWFLVDNTDPATQAMLPRVLDNQPLFQTADVPRLNATGPDRDAFLAWVAENADALGARRAEIPAAFRSPSARVNEGVPWIPLDLSGLDPIVEARVPSLRQQIELIGCPACHATDADFVQTRPDRTFSPFYAKELVARAAHLAAIAEGRAELAPHGPLQADPVLPP